MTYPRGYYVVKRGWDYSQDKPGLCRLCNQDELWTSQNLCRACYVRLVRSHSALIVFLCDWDHFPKHLDVNTYRPDRISKTFSDPMRNF